MVSILEKQGLGVPLLSEQCLEDKGQEEGGKRAFDKVDECVDKVDEEGRFRKRRNKLRISANICVYQLLQELLRIARIIARIRKERN